MMHNIHISLSLSLSLSLSQTDGTIVTDGSVVASDPGPYVNVSCSDYYYYSGASCSINSGSQSCNYTVVKCFNGKL